MYQISVSTYTEPAPNLELTRRKEWLRSKLLHVTFAFVLSRAIIYLSFFLAPLFIPQSAVAHQVSIADLPGVLDAGLRWDYLWYSNIVNEGYHLSVPGGEANVAFWPLYPMLVKGLIEFTSLDSIGLTGILISNVAFFAAIYYLYKLVLLSHPQEVAFRTVLYLSLFPTSFFFSSFYADSLLLLGVSAAFYYQIKGQGIRSGIFGAVAALTHPSGTLLALPMVVEQVLHKRGLRHSGGLLIIVLGISAFPIYLLTKLSNPLASTVAASGGSGGHAWDWPLDTLWNALNLALTDPWTDTGFLFSAIVTTGLIAITAASLRSQRLSFSLWVLALLALYLSLPPRIPLDSMSRYALVFFPCFIMLARWGSRRIVNIAVLGSFLPLLVLLSAMFSQWFWVA